MPAANYSPAQLEALSTFAGYSPSQLQVLLGMDQTPASILSKQQGISQQNLLPELAGAQERATRSEDTKLLQQLRALESLLRARPTPTQRPQQGPRGVSVDLFPELTGEGGALR